jgi:NDP-sugar pyrophosphorylase family protein
MQIAILAGGLATRLGRLAKSQPKSMLKIYGQPFIEYQIERLCKWGITDVVLCIGHLGEQIEGYLGDGRRYGVDIRYSREEELLGTGGAMKKAEPLLDDTFFTMYGDSYLLLDFGLIFSYFQARDKLALMTVYRNYDRHDKSNTVVSDGRVVKYNKREKTDDMVYIDYGAHVFRKEALELIPRNCYFPMEDLFPVLISQQQLLAYEVNERFYEIGSHRGIREFAEYIGGIRVK